MNKFVQFSALAVASLIMSAVIVATSTLQTTAAVAPNFNAYDDVKLHYGQGSEKDFLRLGSKGEQGNTLEVCQDGQVVDLWFYVHNSTAAVSNGENFTGPGVALNTTLALAVDEDQVGRHHDVLATIKADQTTKLSDSVTLTCGDQDISLNYLKVNYFGSPAPKVDGFSGFALRGDLRQGAYLGYAQGKRQGIVPGCWEYRARLNIQLQVEVHQPEPEPEPVPPVIPITPIVPVDDPIKEVEVKAPKEVPDTGMGDFQLTLALLVIGLATVGGLGHYLVTRSRSS